MKSEDYALLYRDTPIDVLRRAVECQSEHCLIWPYGRDGRGLARGTGYGRMKWKGRNRFVHNVVCEIINGPRPPGYHCSHSCHNGAGGCINGSHLSWLPPEENLALNRGKPSLDKKLNPDAVRKMRDMLASGLFSQGEIAQHFGVSKSAVRDVDRGRNWAWVD